MDNSSYEDTSFDEDDDLLDSSSEDVKTDEKENNSWISWSKDTKKVIIWMLIVLVMIGATAAVVLTFTIAFLTNEEKNVFDNGFKQQASVIAEATRFHAKTVVGSLESMSDTITSFTGATASAWPFVSIPDFERRGQRARVEAYLQMIAFSPLVTYEDRHRWALFTSYDDHWMGLNATHAPKNIYRTDDSDSGSGDTITVEDDNILMVPIWMTSPAPHDTSLVNYNIISDETYSFLFNAMTESKHTALSAVYTSTYMYDKLLAPGQHDRMHELSVDNNVDVGSDSSSAITANDIPHSVLMAPVYDNFDLQNRSLAGIIHGTLPWDSYLTELLPPGVNGIIAVLKNSCGQAFTFQINGPKAIYLGHGDLHNPKYRDMAHEVDFGSDFLGEETRTYRQCFYSLVIYPSKEFEGNYKSNDTEKFTALLAAVFGCLAIFFFIFVWTVQMRQSKVMSIATRTTAIISNLFPENVRDRIMKQAEEQANRELHGGTGAEASSSLDYVLEGGNASTTTFNSMNVSSSGHRKSQMPKDVTVLKDAPIADLHPHCTVFFADIVGFTAWSSPRDPAQVFVLLETLYGAFDVIAKRRRVFKVETIGDCYVAVSGLPQPRRDHAVCMARFAHECLAKSSQVFHCLNDTLGTGTSDLCMRIGIHSGPIIAGVLRGEKGRFQLFGDTVNTAARMESNSSPGMIHCSKDTAGLLIEGGKQRWLTERKDKIIAKGKGEMTTYFVNVKRTGGESTSSGESSKVSQGDAFATTETLPEDPSEHTCNDDYYKREVWT